MEITPHDRSETASFRTRTESRNGRRPDEQFESSPPPPIIEADFPEDEFPRLIAMLRESGIRKSPKLRNYLEERVFSWLKETHIVEDDIEALQQAGVTREIIGLALMGVHVAFAVDKSQETFGAKRIRERDQNLLLGSIDFLKKIGKEWSEDADPLDMAHRLENYANMLKLRDQLRELAGVDSILDIAKYSFVGAVKRITGTYHDREVSALIAAMLENSDYHMDAHRAWRRRMYGRLQRTLLLALPLYFHAVNSILSEG